LSQTPPKETQKKQTSWGFQEVGMGSSDSQSNCSFEKFGQGFPTIEQWNNGTKEK
jgi:hypothetical protein